MPICALPDQIVKDPKGNEVNLKDARHWDWPWPLSYVKRSVNAFGPRCPEGSKGYRPWPPQLVKGEGVARWEAKFKTYHSIILIPEFINAEIDAGVYNKTWDAVERNPGAPNFNNRTRVKLFKGRGDNLYSPSALQRFSKKGWMKLSPWYISQWYLLKQMGNELGMGPKEDFFAFHRQGYRPDHVDSYYNWGPMFSLKMD